MPSARLLGSFLLVALCLSAGSAEDKDQLRALLRIPYLDGPASLDLPAIRTERAVDRLGKLNPELLKDRNNPRLNFRAADYMREMGDPGARDYLQKVIDTLHDAEKAKPLDSDQAKLMVQSLTLLAQFDEAEDRLANKSDFDDATRTLYHGELGIFRIFEAARVAQQSPSGDRMLSISLAALGEPESAPKWRDSLEAAAVDLRKAAQLDPKNARPHRSLAVALVAQAYVKSAILWQKEQKTASLMPEEAFAHFKEAANASPDDAVAQWEAYESRVAMERGKGVSSAETLPKEAAKFVASLTARLLAIVQSQQTDSPLAAEILAVITAQGTKPADALQYLDLAQGDPPKPRIQLLRFHLLLALGRPADAIPLGEAVLGEANVPENCLALAVAYDLAGSPEKADSRIVDALAHWPGSPELRLARAVILLRDPTGKGLHDAGEMLNQLINDEDALSDEAQYVRAIYFGLIGDMDGAKRLLAGLAKAMPERVEKARKALGS